MSAAYLWWIPALPLLGSIACGALHLLELRRRGVPPDAEEHGHSPVAPAGPARLAPLVACGAMLLSFAVSLAGFAHLRGADALALESTSWEWIRAGELRFDVSLVLDRLSAVMALVVTGVGALIHVYSVGYMKGDPGYAKFFAFLNLFVFAMLLLVLSSSLLGLFVGWEGVGLCSYLLIGFWYQRGGTPEAAQKAFVANRVGDACFLVGTFLLVRVFGTLDLAAVGEGAAALAAAGERQGELLLAALLLFAGCCGKSAQIPLFVWLPDAMAGPTPVSALIHAATMVTSGIYLVARLAPLFAASPVVLGVIATVGAATALIGASSALFQRDIKKVLAYSTVSQLGYMFLGLGSGAFAGAVFHLVTHAFFKGLLFLGAGSVIHGLHDEQDMHRMGGLKKHMPATYRTFLAGAAALSGLPLLSGYFSKDEILAASFARGGLYIVLWAVGLLSAALTAFYTWRMVALTFEGRERFDPARVHPHESPRVMTVPLSILAVLSIVGGLLLGLPPVLHVPHVLGEWLAPALEAGTRLAGEHHVTHAVEWVLLGLGAAVALFFAHRGFHLYRDGIEEDADIERAQPALTGFLRGAWRIDELYQRNLVQPIKLAAFVIAVLVDQFLIDGLVNGTAAAARAAGTRLRGLADGSIRSYALWMGAGAVLIAFLWMGS